MSTNENTHTKYTCELCSFTSEKYNDYQRHIHTNKHKIRVNANNDPSNYAIYTCDCGKIYKHQSSLCKHKKKCSQLREDNTRDKPVQEHEPEPTKEIITVLLEQNTMFQELIFKNEEDKNELLRINQEEKNELLRINQEEKKELLRRNEEQQNQMMDLQHQFLEAIQKGNTV